MSDDAPGARTLLRGLLLLELLAAAGESVGVTTLATRSGLDKGTTSRLLATLRGAGYVQQDRERRYRPTGKMLQLAQGYAAQLDLRGIARPHLTALRDEVGETVHLGVLEDGQVVYVDKIESLDSIRLVSAIGQTMPVHTTALGRAMLAALPEQERESALGDLRLPPPSRAALANPVSFLRILEQTARRGYAIDDQENNDQVVCVGAAILDARRRPIAAVSVSGPFYRMHGRVDVIGARVRAAVEAVGALAESSHGLLVN